MDCIVDLRRKRNKSIRKEDELVGGSCTHSNSLNCCTQIKLKPFWTDPHLPLSSLPVPTLWIPSSCQNEQTTNNVALCLPFQNAVKFSVTINIIILMEQLFLAKANKSKRDEGYKSSEQMNQSTNPTTLPSYRPLRTLAATQNLYSSMLSL
jgi:hypothetical protein